MLKKILEKQSVIWTLLVGLALIVYGIYLFTEISSTESAGGVVRMKRIFQLLYDFGGKYSILAVFEVIGVISIISGIRQLKSND